MEGDERERGGRCQGDPFHAEGLASLADRWLAALSSQFVPLGSPAIHHRRAEVVFASVVRWGWGWGGEVRPICWLCLLDRGAKVGGA